MVGRNYTRNYLLWSLIVGSVSCFFAGATPLSINEAIRLTLEQSPKIASAAAQVRIAEFQRLNARNKFLPSLDLTANHGLSTGRPDFSPTAPWTSQTTLSLTENLFDGGQSLLQWDLAGRQRDIERLTAVKTRDETILQVAAAFYKYSLSEQLLEVRRKQFEILDKRFRSVTAQYNQGLTPARDYLRFRNQTRRAEIDVQNAETALQQARWALCQAMGIPPDTADKLAFQSVTFASEIPSVPVKIPSIENHYDRKLAQLRQDLTPIQIRSAVLKFYPQLSANLGVNYQVGSYLPNNSASADSWTAFGQLGLTFNFIDFGTRSNAIAIERVNQQKAELEVRRTENELKSAFQNRLLALQQSHRNLLLTRDLLKSEETTYEELRRAYEEGKAPFLDLITSLSTLLDARVQVYSLYFDLLENLARYRYDEGTLYETLQKP